MIHICFSLHDKTGNYSKFTGTAMLSLFENTSSKVIIHLLHDNTLTDDNRDKFIQIAERYGAPLKFYNVVELCKKEIDKIEEYLPQAKESIFSIAMFYRFFIPHLLLPQGIEKAFYLDSDIIVNLDIAEFWKIELGDRPFGAITRSSQIKDAGVSDTNKVIALVKENVVKPEDYFNSGVMLMNLKVLHKEEETTLAGIKFISEHPKYIYLDQDVLNYCFSTSYLKLPLKFNRCVMWARFENEWTIDKKIYHYAASRICFIMDSRDPFNQLFMKYFIKTPWVDADKAVAMSCGIPSRKSYSVSVVIPMYNATEFIGECLDSLLAQTFQDFEVIVVDDCSTDDSREIVESYAPKFNGRLKLDKTETNSGGGGYVPRNIGLMLARGEYIQFLDADDMLLCTALETLYKAAILYDADVVYTGSYYRLNAPNDISLYKDGTTKKMGTVQTDLTVNNPTTNLNRLILESGEGNFHNCWTKFVRRDLLAKDRLLFPYLLNAGDYLWIIELYCHARHFLRISTPLYLYRRYNVNSILRTIKEPKEQCLYWFSSFVKFAKRLHELERENEVLAANPLYCLNVFKKHFLWCLNRTDYARKELDSEELFKVLHSEFSKLYSDSSASLLPFLFSLISEEKKSNDYYVAPMNRFKRYVTAKIYVLIDKKIGKDAIQILSVSDDKALFSKPDWWQRNGTCHVIDSYTGNLEIVAKAIVEGQVQISLGGLYVQDPEDKSKRLPYWIDYTKLIVNGKTILNKLTPVWHDKTYRYKFDVKAEEEIKIQIEWLPHRDTRSDISEDVAKIPDSNTEKLREYEALIAELRTALNNRKITPAEAIKNKREEMLRNTARLDIKLKGASSFPIQTISDSEAKIIQPDWMLKGGAGYIVTSHVGKLELVAQAEANGQLNLNLRGMDIKDPKDSSKRLPYWIDYTKLVVNDEVLFDKVTPVWHDKPYYYALDVKAGEKIKIQTEWLPHKSSS